MERSESTLEEEEQEQEEKRRRKIQLKMHDGSLLAATLACQRAVEAMRRLTRPDQTGF